MKRDCEKSLEIMLGPAMVVDFPRAGDLPKFQEAGSILVPPLTTQLRTFQNS